MEEEAVSQILENYLTDHQLSADLGTRGLPITTRTLREWRSLGKGPPWAKFGRAVLYPRDQFSKWLESQIKKPRRVSA